MRLRVIPPLLALTLAAAGCGGGGAPEAGASADTGAASARPADGGLPSSDMKVTVDTQRVEPTGADSAVAPDAGG
jgi:hypothetical protein